MLTIFRRHLKSCPHSSRKYRRCKCPISVEGSLAGQKIRKSLDLTSWEAAQDLIRQWEFHGKIEFSENSTRVQEAVEKFFEDAQARHLKQSTLRKLGVLLRQQLIQYCKNKGIRYIKELDVEALRSFRATWKDGPLSSQKKLESLRSFFRFCCPQWIQENPAALLKPPKVTPKPTEPFTREEMKKILEACDQYPGSHRKFGQENAKRVKTFMLLLRYSGLRIGDAVKLLRKKLQGRKLFLYTQKTGTPVYVPLPDMLVEALTTLPNSNPLYFFWSGQSKMSTVTGNWRKFLGKLLKIAQVKGHPHRFRDTFAVELLLAGVPLDQVSVLLGHSSIKITEKHYAPWVRARQEQLEESVIRTWDLPT